MKKKLVIIVLSFIVLASIGFIVFLGIKDVRKKQKEKEILAAKNAEINKKVNEINNKYANYKDGLIIKLENDEIASFLNKQVETHNKIEQLEIASITVKDLEDVNKAISTYKENFNTIKSLSYGDFNSIIKSEFIEEEKSALEEIYNNSVITKNIKSDEIKKQNLLDKIINNIEQIQYFKSTGGYYVSNNIVFYKNEAIPKYIKDNNLNIKYELQPDYGKAIPILMYHAIDDRTWGDSSLFVKVSDFEQQMKYLHDNGYTTLFLSEIDQAANYEKPIIITFDDGYMNVYTKALPIMKMYNIKSNFYIISRWMDGETYVTPEIVKEMDNSGIVEIGVHTLSHAKLATKTYEEQLKELSDCKNDLETLLGHNITTVAYPFGSYNSNTINISSNLFKYGVTVQTGFNYEKKKSNLKLNRFKIYRNESLESFKSAIEENE